MTEKPVRKPNTPETGPKNFVTINPQEVVKDNPAFASLTPGSIIGPFDLDRYNKEAVAEYVQVLDTKGNVNWLPYNGHNRTAAAAAQGIGELRVRDSTSEILETYFPGSEQVALTTPQYIERMRILNNTEGDERRMVGQVFNEWKLIVAPEIAERTSALAALHFLSFSEMRDKSPKEIKVVLENPKNPRHPGNLIFDEKKEEKKEITAGIVGMAQSIDTVNISYQDMLKHGLWVVQQMLTSEDDEERASGKKQVRGFLSLPSVHDKVAIVANPDMIQKRNTQLEKLLGLTIANIDVSNDGIQSMQVTRTLYNVLTDTHLNFSDVVTVLTPPSRGEIPQTLKQRYDTQKKYRNTQVVLSLYHDAIGPTEDKVKQLISGLTNRDSTTISLQTKIVDAVSSAMGFFQDSESILVELSSLSGLARRELNNLAQEITTAQKNLLDAQTVQALNSRAKILRGKIIDARAVISEGQVASVDPLPLSPRPVKAASSIPIVLSPDRPSSTEIIATQQSSGVTFEGEVSEMREPVDPVVAEVGVYPPVSEISLDVLVATIKEKAAGELSDGEIAVLVALKDYLRHLFPDSGQAESGDSATVVSVPEPVIAQGDQDNAETAIGAPPFPTVVFRGAGTAEKQKTYGDIAEIVIKNVQKVLGDELELQARPFVLKEQNDDLRKMLQSTTGKTFESLSLLNEWDIGNQPELVYMSASIYYNAVLQIVERQSMNPRGADLASLFACANAIHDKLQVVAEQNHFSPAQQRILQLYPALDKSVRRQIVDQFAHNPEGALEKVYRLRPQMQKRFLYTPSSGADTPPLDDGEAAVIDPVWEERRAHYRPDKDGKGNWFADVYPKNSTTLSEQDRHKVTFMIEKVIKDTFGRSLSRDILSNLSDASGNTGLTAINAMLSERIARLAYDANWDRDKPEFKYLIATFVQRALSVWGRPNLPAEEMERVKTVVTSKKDNKAKPLKYTADSYVFLLEFILCTDPSEPKYNDITFKLRTGMTTNDARVLIQKHFTDNKEWRPPSIRGLDPKKDALAAEDTEFVLKKLDELYRSTILNETDTIEDNADN